MRLPLTFIVLALTLAHQTTFAYPTDVSQSLAPVNQTPALNKRMMGEFTEIGTHTSEAAGIHAFGESSSFAAGGQAHFEPIEQATHATEVARNVKPVFEDRLVENGVRIKPEEDRTKIRSEVSKWKNQLEVYRSDPDTLDIVRRNLQYYEAHLWPSKDLIPVKDQPSWVLSKHQDDWTARGFKPEKMVNLGYSLGLRQDKIITTDDRAFHELQRIMSDLSVGEEDQEIVPDMLNWFKTANMPSLSFQEQEILSFNLRFSNQAPWWNSAEMSKWESMEMPWKQIAEIGDLLKMRTERVVTPDNVIEVRKEILRILDRFDASKASFSAQSPRDPIEAGNFVKMLRKATKLPKAQRGEGVNNEFDLKYVAISPSHDEETAIRMTVLSKGGLHHIPDSNIRDLMRMELLLNGIPPTEAIKFVDHLEYVRWSSGVKLMNGGEEALGHMRGLLPPSQGGSLESPVIYEAMRDYFKPVAAGTTLSWSTFRARVFTSLNRTITRAKGFFSNIGSKFRKA